MNITLEYIAGIDAWQWIDENGRPYNFYRNLIALDIEMEKELFCTKTGADKNKVPWDILSAPVHGTHLHLELE